MADDLTAGHGPGRVVREPPPNQVAPLWLNVTSACCPTAITGWAVARIAPYATSFSENQRDGGFLGSTETSNLEPAEELLVGFTGSDPGPTAEGREWLRVHDALEVYAVHMQYRPSYAIVDHAVYLVMVFFQEREIVYVGQFTIDQQFAYIAQRRRKDQLDRF